MKRGRGDSLTGGTRDVNPQFLTFTASQSAADTTTSTQIALPIQRLPTSGKAQVMEVLKVFYNGTAPLVETDSNLSIFLSTKNFSTTATTWSEPTVFSSYQRDVRITTSGMVETIEPWMQDLLDGAGHGILIATDAIYVQVVSSGTSVANVVRGKLLYRMKNVALPEYIGIVQSQQ